MFKNKLLVLAVIAVMASGVFIMTDGQNNNKGGLKENAFTLWFNANEGHCDPHSKTVFYGEPVGDLPTAYYDINVFDAWYTDPESGTMVTYSTVYSTKGDSVIYAHWFYVYRITYELNSSSAVNDPDNPTRYAKGGGDITLLPATDWNRVFLGWYLDPECQEIPISVIDTDRSSHDYVLYAKWAE